MASFGLYFYHRFKQIESEKIKSELSVLKAQINPHFLFNILNDIYGQAITKSENTADSISKLSSMMRYVLTEANFEKVPLEKEAQYIKSYISLQKRRLTDKTKVEFELTGSFVSKQIPPLLFISFIENAFKYGVSTETETSIIIRIKLENNHLKLEVKNEKPREEVMQIESNNIGLENTKRRLDLLYGDNYSLDIIDDKNFYEVNLKIKMEC